MTRDTPGDQSHVTAAIAASEERAVAATRTNPSGVAARCPLWPRVNPYAALAGLPTKIQTAIRKRMSSKGTFRNIYFLEVRKLKVK